MKRLVQVTMVVIVFFISNNCSMEVKRGFASEEKKNYTCVSCHKNLGTRLPDDHPPIQIVDKESIKRIREIFDVRYTSKFLDSIHLNNDITCKDCHGNKIAELDAVVENRICLGCHDAYKKLTEITAKESYSDKNPHASHLGEIDCIVCHHTHSPSKSYCLECHKNFIMPIPGGGK